MGIKKNSNFVINNSRKIMAHWLRRTSMKLKICCTIPPFHPSFPPSFPSLPSILLSPSPYPHFYFLLYFFIPIFPPTSPPYFPLFFLPSFHSFSTKEILMGKMNPSNFYIQKKAYKTKAQWLYTAAIGVDLTIGYN